jgi:WD40 repeat protein
MGKNKIDTSIDDETGDYNDIALAPNGRTLVAVGDIEVSNKGELALLHIWDLPSRLVAVLDGHKKGVDQAVFTPDSRRLVTIARDDTVRIWQEMPGTTGQFTFLDPHRVFGRSEVTTLGSRQSYGEMGNARRLDSASPYDRGYQDGLALASEKMEYRGRDLSKPGMTAQAVAIVDDAYLDLLKSCEASRDQVIEVQGRDSPDAERLKGMCDAIRKVYAEHGVGK